MIGDAELYDRFLKHLGASAKGEAHAVTAATLTVVLGLPTSEQGKRVVRALAQQAVVNSELVCTSDAGYYVPASKAEVDAACKRLRSQAFAVLERARKAESLGSKRFGQSDADVRSLPLFAQEVA